MEGKPGAIWFGKGRCQMGFFYAALWLAIGVVLIAKMGREHKIFYAAGAFFLLLGAWWAADSLFPDSQLFSGAWGLALRLVTLAALVAVSVVFFIERNRNIKREVLRQKMEEPSQGNDE